MAWKIPLADLDFGPEESEAVLKVLESRWLTMGAMTQQFEEEFAAYTGSKHALAVTNCTAGLHMACMAINLGPGDEVIVPSLTFVATSNAVRYTGATPVFADVTSLQDLTLSLESIKKAFTQHTKAIIVMHYGGYACDMPAIMEFARTHGLYIIEDAAHSAGSVLNDKHLGTWGLIGAYSFFSNKNMTTGEGGMLTTDDDDIAKRLLLLRSHGMTTLTWDRHRGHAFSYDVVDLGYNYRIDEIRAAIGIAQLRKLPRNNERRNELVKVYCKLLQTAVPEVTLPFENHPGYSACHLMPILLPEETDRTRFMEKMKDEGIQTSIHYPPTHLFTAYKNNQDRPANVPLTENIASREVTLPLYPGLTAADLEKVVSAVHQALHG